MSNRLHQVGKIREMIQALRQGILRLDCDIEAVEKFERLINPTNFAYPIEARTMKARRDNLMRTISTLEKKIQSGKV